MPPVGSPIRRVTGWVLTIAVLVAACSPAPAGRSTGSGSEPVPSGSAPTSTLVPSPTVEPTPDAVRIRAPRAGSLLVLGTYPRVRSSCVRPEQPKLSARYPGTLAVRRTDDGTLALTLTLSLVRYLQGIAEVPPTWPRAALEAQAIAARTYALATTGWDGDAGEPLPTPICATTSCQVYRGIPVPFDQNVRRWYGAVRRTTGQVLLFDGRPAQTLYFSTSDGRTYGNDEVFGSAPVPYLRPVVERDDGASPTSRWSVRVPFDDLARFLHRAGEWPGGRTIAEVRLDGGIVHVSGDGTTRSLELATFRDAVNTWAPCLEPRSYPPVSLPVTIPSRWMTLASDGRAAVATGRGWGHGVGMVQWGAYGKALRGLSAPEILAFYYGGLQPQPYPEPGTIHVRVASGLTSLRIVPSGPGARLDGKPVDHRILIEGGDELAISMPP